MSHLCIKPACPSTCAGCNQNRSVLGEVWKGDDFDRDRCYKRLTEAEASALEGNAP